MTYIRLLQSFPFVLSGAMLQAGQVKTGGNFEIGEVFCVAPGGDAADDLFLATGTARRSAAGNVSCNSSIGITSGFLSKRIGRKIFKQ